MTMHFGYFLCYYFTPFAFKRFLRGIRSLIPILRPLFLSGLQQDGKTKIRVEPGLFEWTKWVSGLSLPAWIPPTELAAANFSVDTTYRFLYPYSRIHS